VPESTTGRPAEGTRDRILASARRLFAERGYTATSLADIAADIGVTKTAVAYHFHPKDQLLLEIVAPAIMAIRDELAPLQPTTRAQRRAFLARVVDVLVTHRDVVGILAADTGLLALPTLATADVRGALAQRLMPARPTATDIVRTWATVGAVQVAIARTLDQPVDVVRGTALAAGLAAFDSDGPTGSGRTRGGSPS
jgi:AcrR family transcriptional regulator